VKEMLYNFGGKQIRIPDDEIAVAMKNLGLSEPEAIQMWLEDEGFLDNEEQEALCEKAKENKVRVQGEGLKERKPREKPKTVKVSDEKAQLFNEIVENLKENGRNFEISKQNKLILVKINEKIFKIDLIEQRTKKN
jgi:hypothetical protein